MTHATLTGRLVPPAATATPARRMAAAAGLVLAGSTLIALGSQLALPLPISPVPLTAQTFAVLLVGAVLGSRLAVAAVGLYLLEGLAGLPVFAAGGAGPAWLAGPTGGYLLGFLPAAWITGALAERGWDRRVTTTLAAMALGDAALLGCGMVWLGVLAGPRAALWAGCVPFLPGEAIKVVLAACLLPAAWRVLGRD